MAFPGPNVYPGGSTYPGVAANGPPDVPIPNPVTCTGTFGWTVQQLWPDNGYE